jgi:hypothetical protein
MPARRKVLLRVLLLLAIAMLCGSWLGAVAASLLAGRRREVLLVGRRRDGAIGGGVVA